MTEGGTTLGQWSILAYSRGRDPEPRHDDAAHQIEEPCIPRVVLSCCCCGRGIVYCHPTDLDVAAEMKGGYVCPDCRRPS